MNAGRQHLFWGAESPLSSLAAGGLLIMASGRLAWALLSMGALIWIYCLSALAAFPGFKFFPKQGRGLIVIFAAYFAAGLYLFLLWLLNPFAAVEMFFIVSITPLFCAASGVFKRIEHLRLGDSAARAVSEAAALGALIVIFSIIREPLGYFSLSLPGGLQGMILLFSFEDRAFLPVRIAASSAGALLLLGYGTAMYRYFRTVYAPREEEQ